MNLARKLLWKAVCVGAVTFAWRAGAQTEVYQMSAPIGGQLEGSLTDWGNNPGPNPVICFCGDWTFQNLSETVYLDLTAMTVRQVGFVSVQNPTITATFDDTHSVSGHGVPASLSLSQTLPNGGFSFDTGPQPIVWNASAKQYQLDQFAGNAYLGGIPVTGSYALTTGNHTFSGNLNYSISPNSFPPPNTFTTFTPQGETALVLNGLNGPNSYYSMGPDAVGQEAPPNGFQMQLEAGQDDHLDYFGWSSGSATATLTPTPEPSTYALLGMGLMGLVCLGRRRIRSK